MHDYGRFAIPVIAIAFLASFPAAVHAEFKQNLRYGMTDSTAVRDLQDFLTAEGLYSGKITGSYFSFTERAVRSFQTENGIQPATGIFGRLTRARANEILAANDASSSAPADTSDANSTDATDTSTTNNAPAGSDSLSSTIQDLLSRVQALEEIVAELTAPAPAPSASTYTTTNTTPATSTTTRTTATTTTVTTTKTTSTTTTATTTVRR